MGRIRERFWLNWPLRSGTNWPVDKRKSMRNYPKLINKGIKNKWKITSICASYIILT